MDHIALSPAPGLRRKLSRILTAGLLTTGRSEPVHYALAVALAALARVLIAPATGGIPFLTFYPATAFAAVFCGLGPGLLAALLSAVLASYLFMPTFATDGWVLTPAILIANAIFLLESVLVCLAIHAMRRFHRNYVQAQVELRMVTQAEQRLARIAELLCKTGELGRIGGWHLDLATNRLTCSDEMFRISEIEPPADLPLQQLVSFYAVEARITVRSAMRDAVGKGESWDIEAPYVTAKGNLLWVRSQGAPITDGGRVVALCGALQDITDRKQIEVALRASEGAYRALAESMPQIVWTASPAGNAEYFNRQWYDYTGLEHDASRDFGWSKAIHGDDLAAAWSAWRGAIASQSDFSAECRLRRADGAYRWWLIRCTPLRAPGEGVIRWFGTCTDIEEMKRSEQELRIAATAFESQEAMLITDADGVILKVNRTFCDVTGYRADEIIGMTPRLLKSGVHGADFYSELWRYVGRHGVWQGEILDRRKSGEIFPNWLTITAVRDKAGAATHYVGRFTDISDRKAAEEKIRNMMFLDPLTQLPNLGRLQSRIRETLQAIENTKKIGALLLVDIDEFKTLNNQRGHDAGDQLLVEVARRLQGHLREGDMAARLGSDQFLLLLEDLGGAIDAAMALADNWAHRIRTALNAPLALDASDVRVTAGIGAVLFHDRAHTVDDLLRLVEIALARAKAEGCNSQFVFDPGTHELVIAHERLIEDLRRALQCEQMELYYQVQVGPGRRYVGAEALLRWHHPELGSIPPGKFIPLAEESGFILEIGRWVLETACAQIRRWERRGEFAGVTLAVNVSARQFRQRDFVEQVVQTLQRTGITASRLKLELTESSLLADVDDTIEKMRALKALGVDLSLDDFGTGYSSLAYLSRLPLDQLKIDQSFVRNIGVHASDQVIVHTIIGMAGNLGMDVIAEGVETEAQRAYLESCGCAAFQGYLFGKPLPLAEFEALLRSGPGAAARPP